jgi:hypothetical protein
MDISKLSFLRYVNLRSNKLREFPAVLSLLPKLEVLDLSRNKIKRFPVEAGNLINLRVLSIARNRISSLPRYIYDMNLLKILKLENNPFDWPPSNMLHCDDESEQPQWIAKLKEYVYANAHNAPAETMHPALARLTNREALAASSTPNSTPPQSPPSQRYTDSSSLSYNQPQSWIDEVTSYLISQSTFSTGTQSLDSAHYILFASIEFYKLTELILQTVRTQGSTSSVLTIERELNHVKLETRDLLHQLRTSPLDQVVEKTKVVVKHLRSLLQSLKNLIPTLMQTNGPVGVTINADWAKANTHLMHAIQSFVPDYTHENGSELERVLERIKTRLIDDGFSVGDVAECMAKQTRESIIVVLQLCKTRKYFMLGLALSRAAKTVC